MTLGSTLVYNGEVRPVGHPTRKDSAMRVKERLRRFFYDDDGELTAEAWVILMPLVIGGSLSTLLLVR